jgi:hypothetical protein
MNFFPVRLQARLTSASKLEAELGEVTEPLSELALPTTSSFDAGAVA